MKTKRAFPRRPLLIIEWIDSHRRTPAWTLLDDLQKDAAPLICRSVGWLVAETKEVKLLVSSISGEKDELIREFCSGDIVIPVKAIVRTTVIRK